MDVDFRSTDGICIFLQDFAEGTEAGKATEFPLGFKRQPRGPRKIHKVVLQGKWHELGRSTEVHIRR